MAIMERIRIFDSDAGVAGRGAAQRAARSNLTRKLVEAESPSDNKAAVDACVALAAARARALGGRVKLHRQREFGDVLEVRFGPDRRGPRAGRCCCWGIWIRFGRWER